MWAGRRYPLTSPSWSGQCDVLSPRDAADDEGMVDSAQRVVVVSPFSIISTTLVSASRHWAREERRLVILF